MLSNWPIIFVIVALFAAGVFRWRNPGPTREEIAEQERNAQHPRLLRVATFAVALSGALFLVSFMFSFVMFMNAREDWRRESVGEYRESSFTVSQVYWQKGAPGSLRMGGGSSPTRALARGVVEGREEWMDLIPLLGFIPPDQETVARVVPIGTVLPVYYNRDLQGEYRVKPLTSMLPAAASRKNALWTAKHGGASTALTGIVLVALLRFRRYCLAAR